MAVFEVLEEEKWPHPKSFLQTWTWGEFQRSVGNLPRRFFIADEAIEIFVFSTPLGIFWYGPHAQISVKAFEELVLFAKKENVIFLRIEQLEKLTKLPIGAVNIRSRQPEQTLILDIKKELDQLLLEMHPKTRYNIRLAEKKDLTVSWEKNPAGFNQLIQATSTRDHFGAHSAKYYEKMLALNLTEQVTIYLAGQPIATGIFVFLGKTYTYLHGASANEHRETMAPYLVQWSGITRAKERGFFYYDFWGVAPDGAMDHSWAGVTRFKLGFGGTRANFGQAFELPIKNNIYRLFILWKLFRKKI